MTVLPGTGELQQLLTPQASYRVLRQGFVSALAAQAPPRRVRQSLPSCPGGVAVLRPGLLTDILPYAVKANAKFPDASTAISGIAGLHDLTNGKLLALLDSASVTAWRTGLSAASATDLLSSARTHTVGIIGAGAPAGMTLWGLTQPRTVMRVAIHNADGGRAHRMAKLWQQAGPECQVAGSAREVTHDCDNNVTATWPRCPLLRLPDLWPGPHIALLGADEPGKAELDAQLLQHTRVTVDDLDLVMTSGALGTANSQRRDAVALLGQIIKGTVPARTDAEQVTVYTPSDCPGGIPHSPGPHIGQRSNTGLASPSGPPRIRKSRAAYECDRNLP